MGSRSHAQHRQTLKKQGRLIRTKRRKYDRKPMGGYNEFIGKENE